MPKSIFVSQSLKLNNNYCHIEQTNKNYVISAFIYEKYISPKPYVSDSSNLLNNSRHEKKLGINHLNNAIQIKSIEGQEGQVQDLD